MYSPCRALIDTFLAKSAFVEVYVCDIVGDCYRLLRTNLRAFAAAYAGGLTRLAGNGAFILVDARYEYAHPTGAFLAQFDYAFRAGFYTGTARCAF